MEQHGGDCRKPGCRERQPGGRRHAEDEPLGDEKMEMKVPRGGLSAVYLNIRSRDVSPGGYVLVNVLEFDGERGDEKPIGGCAFLVVHEETARQEVIR